jgi:hypothetical protein
MARFHPFSIYTTKSSDFSNFCGVIGYNFFISGRAMKESKLVLNILLKIWYLCTIHDVLA